VDRVSVKVLKRANKRLIGSSRNGDRNDRKCKNRYDLPKVSVSCI